jgi:uncharacterized protein (DUF2252 family)
MSSERSDAVRDKQRQNYVVETLEDAFSDLMEASPGAFRTKFRKMAADPFAFYRGSACLYYRDLAEAGDDPWVDEHTARVWVHGDLHAENFGTYMNSDGRLVFDVNDFDEAYLGHYTWDLMRFVASFALLGRRKAFPGQVVRDLAGGYLRAYVDQVHHYLESSADDDFALRLDNTEGPLLEVLQQARLASRTELLDATTVIDGDDRRFTDAAGARELDDDEREAVLAAYETYLDTLPENKQYDRDLFYQVKGVVGRAGFGIGSAGLRAYNLLLEGRNQALENDVLLTMKQGNVPAISRYVRDDEAERFFMNAGHRTVVSQRALQAHTDPFLGWTTLFGLGYVVAELSPYEFDLDWDELTEPDQMEPVLRDLGRATAKVHCASDEDSDEDLVDFQTEAAIAEMFDRDRDGFIADVVDRSMRIAEQARADHELFVDAFREGRIGGLSAT